MTEHKTKLHEALSHLTKARDYLSDPRHWLKGAMGDKYDHRSSCAPSTRVCSWGALSKVTALSPANLSARTGTADQRYASCAGSILEETCIRIGSGSIVRMNDAEKTTHADLMAVWNLAIEECEKRIQQYEAGLQKEQSNDQ